MLSCLSTSRSSAPSGKPFLQLRRRILRHLAGFGVHLAEIELAEVGIPGVAVLIEDDVMRLDLPLRQVVFGDDHARRLAGQPRQGFQLPIPLIALAQVDVGEPFRDRLHVAAAVADALEVAVEFLRPLRCAAGIITGHAVDDRLETVGVVLRAHNAFQRVAADAIEQVLLVLLLARHADDPFGIGQLGGEVFGLAQLEVGLGLLAGSDVGRAGAVKIVAGGANLQRVMPRLQPRGREAVTALVVADDRDGDARAVLFGADHHAFHRAFLG